LDSDKKDKSVVLIDASHLGTVIKEGNNTKTLLSTEDENLIIDTFNNNVSLERFSEVVDSSEIEKNNYSINPGQYFNVSKTIHNITQQEFDKIQKSSLIKIEHLFDENLSNGKQIVQILKKATLNDQK
jgi:type I restriction enzyme M protein